MKKSIFKIFFGLLILPASVVGTFYYLNENGFFNIENIDVVIEDSSQDQAPFLKPHVEKLRESLGKYKGLSLWNIKLSNISQQIAQFDWIDNVRIHRRWPAALTIEVKPFEVKMLYMTRSGKLFPIIKNGAFLGSVEQAQTPDVVLLEGDSFLKSPELRKKAVNVIDQIPSKGSFSKKTISEVGFDEKEGFWMTMIKTGVRVKIGDDLVSLKAARVGQVVDYLENHQFEARVIDANLSKKVLVSLRKDP